jgi:hypothetical protein
MKLKLPIFAFLILAACGICFAQANPSSVLPGQQEDENVFAKRSFREQMEKLRIAKEKKEYEELLERGQQALRLSEELEASQQLTGEDVAKLESLEKIVKKIRGELGGRDDDGNVPDAESEPDNEREPASLGVGDALKNLKDQTVKLVDELKKTTRFSISAAAIQSSNAVLRLTRFLRLRR